MEAGKVIKVDPLEKAEIPAGTVVKVYVSIGVEQKQVPNLIGKTEEQAKQEIAAAGLKWKGTLNKADSGKTNNVIIEQSIVAGSVVDKDTEITITLNKFDELKTGSINVNVIELLGGYTPKQDDEGNALDPETVKVVLTVDGVEYATKEAAENSTSCSFSVDSTGSKTATIQIKSATGSVRTTKTFTFNAGENKNIP